MSEFIIATASTADLERSFLEEHNIPFIPYTYMIDGCEYFDDCTDKTRKTFFDAMRQGKDPSTSQIPVKQYEDFFAGLLASGKDIIFLDMSRGISNSYNNALTAYISVKDNYPDRKFHMVDTRCITGGLALLVTKLVELKESGATYDQCIKWTEDTKMHIIHHFVVNDLKWLRKGGRLSNAASVIGTLLNIKPILYVTDEGTLVASAKVRGRKSSLMHIVNNMKEDLGDPAGKEVFIFHADCEKDALFMADKMRELYPTLGDIKLFLEGPTVGSHVGPGFISVHYIGTDRTF